MPVVDAEGAVNAWVNSLTALVGPGNAIPLGAHLGDPLKSPAAGAYVLLQRVGGTRDLTAEKPVDRARISAQIYGGTKALAERGARAYANAVESLDGIPTVMGPTANGDTATCWTVDNMTGPQAIDDHETTRDRWRYLVDADFYLSPA